MTGSHRKLFHGLEAIINGMFGIFLCVTIGLLPLLSLERQLPWMPAGDESVIIVLLACVVLEGVNIWRSRFLIDIVFEVTALAFVLAN